MFVTRNTFCEERLALSLYWTVEENVPPPQIYNRPSLPGIRFIIFDVTTVPIKYT